MVEAITGRIYRIISDSHPECLPYYGSTTTTLKRRWFRHKSAANNTCSKQLMGFEDVRMELLEEFVCDSRATLRQREQWWIDNHPCCNKINAVCDKKKYQKAYRETHKETIKEKQQEYDKANCERKSELRRIRRAKAKLK